MDRRGQILGELSIAIIGDRIAAVKPSRGIERNREEHD
jgi:hypothetical protein